MRCPDGTTQFVFKNVDHAFPFFFKQAKTSAAAAISGLEQISFKLSADQASNIRHVLMAIDEKNASVQAHLRAAYVLYTASPCKKLDYLQLSIEAIRQDEQDLRAVELLVSQLSLLLVRQPPSKDRLTEILEQQIAKILATLNKRDPLARLPERMAQAPTLIEEWRNQ